MCPSVTRRLDLNPSGVCPISFLLLSWVCSVGLYLPPLPWKHYPPWVRPAPLPTARPRLGGVPVLSIGDEGTKRQETVLRTVRLGWPRPTGNNTSHECNCRIPRNAIKNSKMEKGY